MPVSSGAPHFHGDTVPSAPGAVMLDLRRMDKILRVDRRNRMVVIEPGVTYPQLQAALAAQGMRVTPPLLPRANKSVVASLLERQPTLIPRYNFDLPEPLRDCGVVWGSGEVMFHRRRPARAPRCSRLSGRAASFRPTRRVRARRTSSGCSPARRARSAW